MLTNEQPYRDMEPAAIAYGVATLKLTLPIPHNCPENFKGLLKSTWMPDPAERPMFADICVQLKQLQESPFYATPGIAKHKTIIFFLFSLANSTGFFLQRIRSSICSNPGSRRLIVRSGTFKKWKRPLKNARKNDCARSVSRNRIMKTAAPS